MKCNTIPTLSLHDALPIFTQPTPEDLRKEIARCREMTDKPLRSEEHTSELQSHVNLVCRLLLEKKKTETAQFQKLITRWNEKRPIKSKYLVLQDLIY